MASRVPALGGPWQTLQQASTTSFMDHDAKSLHLPKHKSHGRKLLAGAGSHTLPLGQSPKTRCVDYCDWPDVGTVSILSAREIVINS